MKTKLVVVGAGGRMGKRIIALAAESGQFVIAGAVERQGHPDIGKNAGLIAGAGALDVKLADTFPKTGEVVIDFSLPEAADKTLDHCIENKVALVSGTTGLNSKQKGKFKASLNPRCASRVPRPGSSSSHAATRRQQPKP